MEKVANNVPIDSYIFFNEQAMSHLFQARLNTSVCHMLVAAFIWISDSLNWTVNLLQTQVVL